MLKNREESAKKPTTKTSASKKSAPKPKLFQPTMEQINNLNFLKSLLNHLGYTCKELVYDLDGSIYGKVETGTEDSINFRASTVGEVIEQFKDAVEDFLEWQEDNSVGNADDESDKESDKASCASCLCEEAPKPMFHTFVETTVEYAAVDGTKHSTQAQASQINLAHNLRIGLQAVVNFHFQQNADLTRSGTDVVEMLSRLVGSAEDSEEVVKFLSTTSHIIKEAVNTYVSETNI